MEATQMLTLEILIPIAWLAIVALVVAMCSVSAHSEDEPKTVAAPAAWIKVGVFGFRGGARETRTSGRVEWGETRETLVRELSRV